MSKKKKDFHAVIFDDGQKRLYLSSEAFQEGTKNGGILKQRSFSSKADAEAWLCNPDSFPIKKRFYAVKAGKRPGIYETAKQAKEQIKGFSNYSMRSFYTRNAAMEWMGDVLLDPVSQNFSSILHGDSNVFYCKVALPHPLIIYTDASFKPSGDSSYAFCIIDRETETEMTFGGKSPKAEVKTVEDAELYAILMAMRSIGTESRISVSIFTDSHYVFHHVHSNSKFGNLWDEFYSYAKIFDISLNWVKGHNGNKYNCLCDTIAKRMNF